MRSVSGQGFGLAAVYLASVAACGGEPETSEPCRVRPGELVISEIMPNPLGDDSGKEWFEILNTSPATQPLGQVVLERLGRNTDGSEKLIADHTMKAGAVMAGQYFVLGAGGPSHYLYNPGTDKLGDLNNTSAGLRLRCQGEIIDTIWYGEGVGPAVQEGKSLGLDGGVVPDAALNDEVHYWCAGGATYDADGNTGTPGEPNAYCGLAACQDGAVFRPTLPPAQGDLVVTETFADPTGADAGKEWLELYVTAGAAVDLNGLKLLNISTANSRQDASVASVTCVRAEPGDYVVIGASADPLVNGGLAVGGVASDLALFGTASSVELSWGGELIDTAGLPAASEGVSISLDPQHVALAANDVASNFCDSKTTSLFSGTGTPGQANDLCGTTCLEGATPRVLVPPQAGDLVITEIYADPSTNPPETTADNNRDWFELYVAAAAPVDLNGLRIENQSNGATVRSGTLSDNNCISVAPASYVIVAGSNAAADGVTASATFTLTNQSGTLLYNQEARLALQYGATVIDTVGEMVQADPGTLCCPSTAVTQCTCVANGYPAPTAGVSYAFDGAMSPPAAAGNDNPLDWCAATAQQGFTGGLGSPGVANASCP